MTRSRSPFRLPPRWRWITGPVIALGSGGAAVAMWLEENGVALSDCAPPAGMAALAALLYWFNHLVFKAAHPRPRDMEKSEKRRMGEP